MKNDLWFVPSMLFKSRPWDPSEKLDLAICYKSHQPSSVRFNLTDLVTKEGYKLASTKSLLYCLWCEIKLFIVFCFIAVHSFPFFIAFSMLSIAFSFSIAFHGSPLFFSLVFLLFVITSLSFFITCHRFFIACPLRFIVFHVFFIVEPKAIRYRRYV